MTEVAGNSLLSKHFVAWKMTFLNSKEAATFNKGAFEKALQVLQRLQH